MNFLSRQIDPALQSSVFGKECEDGFVGTIDIFGIA
jgi:hypothetical protein